MSESGDADVFGWAQPAQYLADQSCAQVLHEILDTLAGLLLRESIQNVVGEARTIDAEIIHYQELLQFISGQLGGFDSLEFGVYLAFFGYLLGRAFALHDAQGATDLAPAVIKIRAIRLRAYGQSEIGVYDGAGFGTDLFLG